MSTLPLASQTSGLPGIATGDSGSGAASDPLMTLTGEVSSLTLLSDGIGVMGAAAMRLPEAVSDGPAGGAFRDAQSSST